MKDYDGQDGLIGLSGNLYYSGQEKFDREEWLSEQINLLSMKLSTSSISLIDRVMMTAELERYLGELERLLDQGRRPKDLFPRIPRKTNT